MNLPRMTRPIILLIGGLALHGQDAGMVLRTSVTYRTQRNSLQLTDEQKATADQLAADAARAGQSAKFGDAMRDYYHAMAVMRGVAWTPAYEFGTSLQAHLDHAVVDPGKPVTVTLLPLYDSKGARLMASLSLMPAKRNGGAQKSLGPPVAVDPGQMPFSTKVSLPADAMGGYVIEVRLAAEGDSTARQGGMVKSLPLEIDPIAASAQALRDRLAKVRERNHPALASAEYALDLYERADRGEVNPTAYQFSEEFAKAREILDGLDAGRDPFAGKHGDFRKAYRSAVDHTLQPYRLLIPASYSAATPAALVLALHGMGGDENSMFDGYEGKLKPEAERLGFVVVCPKGRDSASMYRGAAEQDVLDVLAEVRRDYKIDAGRIYLMGHSMGGYGTWSVAMAHPALFAALGPISGGGSAAGMAKIAAIPEYVVHGDDDRTVPVTQSRTMVEAGKKAGANIVYVEVHGGSHTSVAAPQFGPMLDFFAKQRRAVGE